MLKLPACYTISLCLRLAGTIDMAAVVPTSVTIPDAGITTGQDSVPPFLSASPFGKPGIGTRIEQAMHACGS